VSVGSASVCSDNVMTAAVFAAAEAVIERGQCTFLEVGAALLTTRDGGGHRHAGYATWEAYLAERWPNIGRAHAYRLVQAAEVIESVVPGRQSDESPFDFKHAAFLAPLPLEERRALAAVPDFSRTPIAELYRRRRAARQETEQLSAAIAEQRAAAKPSTHMGAELAPDPSDDEVHVGFAEALPWADGSIDLIVTSPPYCLGEKVPYADGGDYDDYDAYLELVSCWTRELARVSHPEHGRICVDVPIDTDRGGWRPAAHHWQTALEAAGWKFRTQIVWNKAQAGSGTDRGSLDSAATPNVTAPVELVLVYYRGTWSRAMEMDTRLSDLSHDEWLQWCGPRGVWDFPGEHDAGHPAVFPDELVRRCIKLFSLVGDVVGDPFCGRGTTARVGAQLNRRVCGIDRSPTYVARAQAEIAAARAGRVELAA
jgi:site-specific DNA-methyltransferase (adenine-specific)